MQKSKNIYKNGTHVFEAEKKFKIFVFFSPTNKQITYSNITHTSLLNVNDHFPILMHIDDLNYYLILLNYNQKKIKLLIHSILFSQNKTKRL